MKLTDVHITNYRPVEDSDQFGIEPDVTCLVGKNESGKTANLQALYRLNPIETSKTFDEDIDFPAKRTRDRKKYRAKQQIPVVTATFELTDKEAGRAQAQFGPNALKSRSVVYTKGYRKSASTVQYELDEKAMIAHLAGQLDPTSRAATKDHDSVEDFLIALRGLDTLAASATELLQRLDGRDTAWDCVHQAVDAELPTFVYFDDYDSMPGKVSIPVLIRKRDENQLDRGEQALLSLLNMAGAELEDFMQVENHERLVRGMENAGATISDEVFEYWSQNTELAVELTVMQPEAGAEPPLNEGPILWVRVKNHRHRASVPFDERSRGFVWFFSFLAYFTNLENEAEGDLILLLDEPGLSLHARAQEDLLRLIDERLAPKHQVIYTTHSPFMVSADHLKRVRAVIDRDGLGTKVSAEIFKADEDTAFPLYAAMGIGMTQSLFIGEHTLLLEGPSDLIYLDVLSDALTEQARTGLDPRWVKTPIGGAGKLSTFATLLGANKLNVAVLVDSSTKDTGAVKRLRDNGQLAAGGLLEIGDFTGSKDADIEDLLGEDFYLELVNHAYAVQLPKKISKRSLKSKDPRMVRRIETYFRDNNIAGGRFDHYKPAAKLLRDAPDLVPTISADALTAAENLFKKINELLPEDSLWNKR